MLNCKVGDSWTSNLVEMSFTLFVYIFADFTPKIAQAAYYNTYEMTLSGFPEPDICVGVYVC